LVFPAVNFDPLVVSLSIPRRDYLVPEIFWIWFDFGGILWHHLIMVKNTGYTGDSSRLEEIYRFGQAHAGQSWYDLLYAPGGDRVGQWIEDPVSYLFLEAGLEGEDKPRWVEAERYGLLPEAGKSRNHADDCAEPGVSVAHLLDDSDDYDWAMGGFGAFNRPMVRVAGWLHFRRGSDGEPVLVGAVEI
jgi:hypothetical protein